VGLNKEKISKYIKEQQEEDMMKDKMTTKEYVDPFKG
jgi:putative transposase